MSAALQPPGVRPAPMTLALLDEVAAIEALAYSFPWTRGNFIDSLAAGYLAEVLLDADGRVVAYDVAMKGVDEMHLLNLTVAPSHQGRGHALSLMDRLVERCRAMQAATLWLEVRQSNERAQAIYRRYGFREVGWRRGYYPAPAGQREDALVMRFAVADAEDRAVPGAELAR
jgi:ribosomal-protein-alanine N-acetyltransferase